VVLRPRFGEDGRHLDNLSHKGGLTTKLLRKLVRNFDVFARKAGQSIVAQSDLLACLANCCSCSKESPDQVGKTTVDLTATNSEEVLRDVNYDIFGEGKGVTTGP
jgi:hypothetical protein